MNTKQFFQAPDPQNMIKTQIISKYFKAWSKIMLANAQTRTSLISYVDLFSGPGRFDDGTPSTPIWLLNYALETPALHARLTTMFNDKSQEFAQQLRDEISSIPGIEILSHLPRVTNVAVGSGIVQLLRSADLVPTLFFVDPFGYKGLSLDLIWGAIKSWGCDCIFFFNYNRINPALGNSIVDELMDELFGGARAETLRQRVHGKSPDDRQTIIINELTEALGDVGGRYVLPFEFESEHGKRPSHYIIFVSKAFRGYHIMKDVMESLSSDDWEVKNFEYVSIKSPQMKLFADLERKHSISALKDLLSFSRAGTTQRVERVYESNTVGTPYTLRNVKDAILGLEREGRVTIDIPANRRMRGGKITLGNDRIVSFPGQRGNLHVT